MTQNPEQPRPEDVLNSLAQGETVDKAQLLEKLSQTESEPIADADIAAVLDATAFKPKHDKAGALDAMINGQWQDESAAEPEADQAGSEDEVPMAGLPDDGMPVSRPGIGSSQSRANRGRLAARSSGDTFKKFLVPPLLVTGILVWVLAAIVVYMMGEHRIEKSGLNTAIIVAALPLGAILMAGAWLFHRETAGK